MQIKTQKLLQNPRLLRALTGLTLSEFHQLLPTFESSAIQLRYELTPGRVRKVGGGRRGKLPTWEDKLVFILFYLKHYPTYDVMGFLFDLEPSRCLRNGQFLLASLEKALGRSLSLPKKKITSVEELFTLHPELKDVFIDGTERKVNKPKKLKSRDKLYSGKKKSHTRKSIVMCDEDKRILFLTQAKSGRRHDKRLADKNMLAEHIPEDVTIWTDTGFQGMQKIHANTIMPKKATKKHPLTPEQRESNRITASIRIVNEHAIGGMKRYRAAADTYRNRIANMDDLLMRLSAGLWNFHLQYAS
jgi:DDE superfamily endonuclease/Helix-turn-helix of DDE superfamily endonuclease